MNKKLLVSLSIGASIIITLTSLSSVVAFQTAKTAEYSNISPLYAVRTTTATKKEEKTPVTNYYLGKNKNNRIIIPKIGIKNKITQFLEKIQDNLPKLINHQNNDPFLQSLIDDISPQQKLQKIKTQINNVENNKLQHLAVLLKNNPELAKNPAVLNHVIKNTFSGTMEPQSLLLLGNILIFILVFILGIIVGIAHGFYCFIQTIVFPWCTFEGAWCPTY